MSLLDRFMQNIADICDIDVRLIQQDGNKILVDSYEFPFLGVFFNEDPEEPSAIQWIDYFNAFDAFKEEPDEATLKKKQSNDTFKVKRLNILNKKIGVGVYEISEEPNSRIVVFTGGIDGTLGDPDLTSFPEVLLAIATLEKICCVDSGAEPVSWANVLKCLGPFAIFSEDRPSDDRPLLSLGECGVFLYRQNTFSFTWSNNLPGSVQTRGIGVPEEAEKAYLAALQDSGTADVAFLRLYRVLEILFAGTYKDEISNADLSKVIALIQRFQSMSELDTLKKLVEKSTSDFTRFTKADFGILFDGHQPQGNYQKITSWLDDKEPTPRALIIYYIRCALVHSKMNEKEPFLIGPFANGQEDALRHLVEDTRELIKSLLY